MPQAMTFDEVLTKYNPNHQPAGSPRGGEFAPGKGKGGSGGAGSGARTFRTPGGGRATNPQPGDKLGTLVARAKVQADLNARMESVANRFASTFGIGQPGNAARRENKGNAPARAAMKAIQRAGYLRSFDPKGANQQLDLAERHMKGASNRTRKSLTFDEALAKYNPNHHPAGSPRGGEFAPGKGKGGSDRMTRTESARMQYNARQEYPKAMAEATRRFQASRKTPGSKARRHIGDILDTAFHNAHAGDHNAALIHIRSAHAEMDRFKVKKNSPEENATMALTFDEAFEKGTGCTARDLRSGKFDPAKATNGGMTRRRRKDPLMKGGGYIAPEGEADFELVLPFKVTKLNEEQRLVSGWASITKKDGQEVVDLQGDVIDIEELRKAAHEFMSNSRTGSDMHGQMGVSSVVESIIIDDDMRKALGIASDIEGWFITQKIHDDNVWAGWKSGRYTGFSIGGSGTRTAMAE